jgi:hypothetical protein
MRPVDMQPRTLHPHYDGSLFDNITGAPLWLISDTTWTNAKIQKIKENNRLYHYFRHNYAWPGGPAKGGVPVKPAPLPLQPADQIIGAAVAVPAWQVATDTYDTANPLNVNARLVQVQKGGSTDYVLRVLLSLDQALDLWRVWKEGVWNGVTPTTISKAVAREIAKRIEAKKKTAPNIPAWQPGTFYGYRGAMRELVPAIGRYCSYCECRGIDGDTFEIEHRLAKSAYPSDYLRWENFLLACGYCNQAKNPQPDRASGTQLAIAGGAVAPVPYHQIRLAAEKNYHWPSSNDSGVAPPAQPTNYSLRCVKYRLIEYNAAGAQVGQINAQDAVHFQNQGGDDDATGRFVNATVWNSVNGATRQALVRVELAATNPGTGAPALDAQKLASATRTITMCNLNGIANAGQDRRAIERTHAWFKAIEKLRGLRDALTAIASWELAGAPPGPTAPLVTDRNQLWNNVAGDAELSGYFSVWLTVFRRFSATGAANGIDYATRLVNALNQRGTAVSNNPYRYRGWSLQNSVLSQIPNI